MRNASCYLPPLEAGEDNIRTVLSCREQFNVKNVAPACLTVKCQTCGSSLSGNDRYKANLSDALLPALSVTVIA